MIRKKCNPAKVCTGRRRMEPKEPEICEEPQLFEPDVRVMDLSTPEDPNNPESKIYNIIPLHKSIHIVSSSQLAARRKAIQENKCKTLVDWDTLPGQSEKKTNELSRKESKVRLKKIGKNKHIDDKIKTEEEEEINIPMTNKEKISIRLKLNRMDYSSAYESLMSEGDSIYEVDKSSLINENETADQSMESLNHSLTEDEIENSDDNVEDKTGIKLEEEEEEPSNHSEIIYESPEQSYSEDQSTISVTNDACDKLKPTRKRLTKRIRLDTMKVIHDDDDDDSNDDSNERLIIDNN